jgi:hypothetical protein
MLDQGPTLRKLQDAVDNLDTAVSHMCYLTTHAHAEVPDGLEAPYRNISALKMFFDDLQQRITFNIDILSIEEIGYKPASDSNPNSRLVYNLDGFAAAQQLFREHYTMQQDKSNSQITALYDSISDLILSCRQYMQED